MDSGWKRGGERKMRVDDIAVGDSRVRQCTLETDIPSCLDEAPFLAPRGLCFFPPDSPPPWEHRRIRSCLFSFRVFSFASHSLERSIHASVVRPRTPSPLGEPYTVNSGTDSTTSDVRRVIHSHDLTRAVLLHK